MDIEFVFEALLILLVMIPMIMPWIIMPTIAVIVSTIYGIISD